MSGMAIINFKTDYSNGKQVDWVLVAPRDSSLDKVQTWHRVKDLKPKEDVSADLAESEHYRALLDRWELVSPAYEAWKAGEAMPETGMPLAAWAGVSSEQADFLKKLHILTVEHVAEMSREDTAKLPWPNSNKLPKLAADFLASKEKSDASAEMEAMREKMAAMEEMLAEYITADELPKRKPGRPKKAENADH